MVKCSGCGTEGHTRRSIHCPNNVHLLPTHLQPFQQQHQPLHPQQQQQPQQTTTPRNATLYSLAFITESFVDPKDELFDRVFLYSRVFEDEFIYSGNDVPQQPQPHPQPQQNDDNKVFLIKITNPSTLKSIVVNVGAPHREANKAGIYAPSWILEALDINDIGEVTWEKIRTPPVRATKISLRPLDSMMEHIDARAEIEEHLKMFNVLQEGTTISVPLRPFDNYIARVFVEKIEPVPVVLLRDEVELELLESAVKDEDIPTEQQQQQQQNDTWDPSQPSGRPPTPIPEEPAELFSPNVDNYLATLQPPSLPKPLPLGQDEKANRRRVMAEAAERRRLQLLADEANAAN